MSRKGRELCPNGAKREGKPRFSGAALRAYAVVSPFNLSASHSLLLFCPAKEKQRNPALCLPFWKGEVVRSTGGDKKARFRYGKFENRSVRKSSVAFSRKKCDETQNRRGRVLTSAVFYAANLSRKEIGKWIYPALSSSSPSPSALRGRWSISSATAERGAAAVPGAAGAPGAPGVPGRGKRRENRVKNRTIPPPHV